MHALFLLLVFLTSARYTAQKQGSEFSENSLMVISSSPDKGFHHDYLLFIPKGTPLKKMLYLLVEPNNTGRLSDSTEVHRQHAAALASVSSVGHNVSTELKIPLLVPVFPRPASKPLMYTHALDRDVMLEKSASFYRPDLQLLAMVEDARTVLKSLQIMVEQRFLMTGFSASATFANRFSFLHPDQIKALAIGGFNGNLMLPHSHLKGVRLHYPIGIYDFEERFGQPFRSEAWKALPQYIYMGALDTNDAVQFADAYSNSERKLINTLLAPTVQERFSAVRSLYDDFGAGSVFKTWSATGHETTGEMNLAVIKFFLEQMSKAE